MIRDTLHSIRQSVSVRRVRQASVVVGLCVLLVASMAPVAAQFGAPDVEVEVEESDDFEDGNIDGWDGQTISLSDTSTEGDHSLRVLDGFDSHSDRAVWTAGPNLDLSEEFEITFTARNSLGSDPIRYGIIDDNNEGAAIIFHGGQGETWVGNPASPAPDDTIDHGFSGEWLNVTLASDGDGELSATVWEHGTTKPSEPQISNEFAGETGSFSINPGVTNNGRVAYLDSVTVEGQQTTSQNLTIETGQLLEHGESQPYRVTLDVDGETQDMTDAATVESLNTSVITVNESAERLEATDNTDVNQRVTIRAEHENATGNAFTEVVVAEPTVENLEVLPPVWRIGAILGDWTVILLIIASGAGIVGTRLATSFMGLSMMELVLVIGWFGGYLSTGLAMTSVFACLFIGLNLAANIDYQVQR